MASKTLYSVSGRLGITPGMDTSALDMVTEDNDGEIPAGDNHQWIIDISHLMSEQLGKQLSMMATYRVKGIHFSLRNVNNTVDNDASLAYGGTIGWYSPTKHRIDALQHARDFKRKAGMALNADNDNDPFAPWPNDRKYRGLRFNWSSDTDSVSAATDDDTTMLAGTEFSMYEIFDHYNQAIGGSPSEEGYDSAGSEGDAIWATRIGLNQLDSMYWNTAYTNRMYQNTETLSLTNDAIYAPSFQTFDWHSDSNHLSVLGGLMKVTGIHTSTDMSGFTEDEYYIQATIQIEGWEEF